MDSLVTVRQLKEKGVEVFFEKENIFTLDSKGELLITIMSSLAQEESRSISENVTWGQRKRFADGKVSLPYKQFLGYEKGEDDLPKIVEKEAEIVRLIYALYLEGCTAYGITQRLEKQGIPSPAGKARWSTRTVESILQNEKYKGDAILQKSYTVDFLTKRKKANEGELPQYYIEHSHPAIVTKEVYELVQVELRQRKTTGHASTASCFSAKVVCGCCGGFFGSKLWHSTDKYRRTIWQCNNKFKGEERCTTPHVTQQQLEEAFVREVNGLVAGKDVILDTLEGILKGLTDTSGLDKSIAKLEGERQALLATLQQAVDTNAHATQNQEEYQQRYTELVAEHDRLKQRIEKLTDERTERHGRRLRLVQFMDTLRTQGLIDAFDERLFRGTVDRVVVGKDSTLVFVWRDGQPSIQSAFSQGT